LCVRRCPKAYKNNSRFIDCDLNRAFLNVDINNHTLYEYEENRAKVINQLLGPKSAPKTDFIIDIHTTTSNMGITIILVDDNSFNLKLASYLKTKIKGIFIFYILPGDIDRPYLASISKYGFALEIGPIPNGVVRDDVLLSAFEVVNLCFEFIDNSNNGIAEYEDNIELFEYVKTVKFPTNESGDISAIIHKDIQDKDFTLLQNGQNIFKKFNGEIIKNKEKSELYPVFINEAAYYDQKIAFTLTKKKNIKISQVSKLND